MRGEVYVISKFEIRWERTCRSEREILVPLSSSEHEHSELLKFECLTAERAAAGQRVVRHSNFCSSDSERSELLKGTDISR